MISVGVIGGHEAEDRGQGLRWVAVQVLGEHRVAVHGGDRQVDPDRGQIGLIHLQGERAELILPERRDLDVETVRIARFGEQLLRFRQIEGVLSCRRGVANHRGGHTVQFLAAAIDALVIAAS